MKIKLNKKAPLDEAAPYVVTTAAKSYTPDEGSFTALYTAMEAYEPNKHDGAWTKKHFMSCPWGIAWNVSPVGRARNLNTAIKYFFTAAIIGWDELVTQLQRTLSKSFKTTKEGITAYAAEIEKQLNTVMAARDRGYQNYCDSLKTESLSEDIEKHDELNPKLFKADGMLKDEVRAKIEDIVTDFTDYLGEDGIEIAIDDVILIGSNVSYNYTKDSDLDIHIIANTKDTNCPDNLYPKVYSAYRSLYNKNMDIDFYGIPVEVYVETEDSTRVSNGEYSVRNNKWNREPEIESIPDIDNDGVRAEFAPWKERYDEILKDPTIEAVDSFLEEIYDLRKEAIASDEGEYNIGNLVFKEVRNNGFLDNLKEIKNELTSEKLSLESLQEDLDNNVLKASEHRIEQLLNMDYDDAIHRVQRMIEDALSYSDMEITIRDIAFTGSQRFGEPTESSDLDVVFGYTSDNEDDRIREDDLFNYLSDPEYPLTFQGYKLDINPQEDCEDLTAYLLNASKFKKERVNEAYLEPRVRREFVIQLSQAAHTQPIIQDNGLFHLYNIKESEITNILSHIRNLDFVDQKYLTYNAGRFDFSRPAFGGAQPRLYTISGRIKDEYFSK